jgi:hypothetical protein
MHVLQWIAVQADNDDEAMRSVEEHLTTQMGNEYHMSSWYDWFVIGGGRFNPDQNPYQSSSNMIIGYKEDPEKFKDQIAQCMTNRVDEFNNYRRSYDEKNIDMNTKLDSYTGEMQYDFELYPLKKMIDMIQGEWDYNSYYYDQYHDSTNTEHMKKKLDIDDNSWYLVPVDFHF